MLNQLSSKIKKVLAISMAVLFVVSLTTVAVEARGGGAGISGGWHGGGHGKGVFGVGYSSGYGPGGIYNTPYYAGYPGRDYADVNQPNYGGYTY